MDENNTPKKSRRFLVIYCIAIFIFAAFLIFLSSLSQARLVREADEIKNQLSSTTTLAEGAQNQLRAVMTENEKLSDTIKALEKEKTGLEEKSAELEKKLSASQKLSELVNLKRLRKNSEFKKRLSAFETDGFPAFLSAEDMKIYNSIK